MAEMQSSTLVAIDDIMDVLPRIGEPLREVEVCVCVCFLHLHLFRCWQQHLPKCRFAAAARNNEVNETELKQSEPMGARLESSCEELF